MRCGNVLPRSRRAPRRRLIASGLTRTERVAETGDLLLTPVPDAASGYLLPATGDRVANRVAPRGRVASEPRSTPGYRGGTPAPDSIDRPPQNSGEKSSGAKRILRKYLYTSIVIDILSLVSAALPFRSSDGRAFDLDLSITGEAWPRPAQGKHFAPGGRGRSHPPPACARDR